MTMPHPLSLSIEEHLSRRTARLYLGATPLTNWRAIDEITDLRSELSTGQHRHLAKLNEHGMAAYAVQWLTAHEPTASPLEQKYFALAVQHLAAEHLAAEHLEAHHRPAPPPDLEHYTYCPRCQIAYSLLDNWRWDNGRLVCVSCEETTTQPAGADQLPLIAIHRATEAAQRFLLAHETDPSLQLALRNPTHGYRIQRWMHAFIAQPTEGSPS